MNKKYFPALIIGFAIIASSIFGGKALANEDKNPLHSFQFKRDLHTPKIVVPTTFEFNLPLSENKYDIGVLDLDTNKFIPYYFRKSIESTNSVSAISNNESVIRLLDNEIETYEEFEITDTNTNNVTIQLDFEKAITASALSLQLGTHVALPNTITIIANGKTVVNNQELLSSFVHFPTMTATKWTLTLNHSQLLRINELNFSLKDSSQSDSGVFRFLAQPNHKYLVYSNADRIVNIETDEASNLSDDEGIKNVRLSDPQHNSDYQLADIDEDGIEDIFDNCVYIANNDQNDIDGNNLGDACEDFDRDGIMNSKDNCRDTANHNQLDADGDKIGDKCDGVESRLTEKYSQLPWIAMVIAFLLLLFLSLHLAKDLKNKK